MALVVRLMVSYQDNQTHELKTQWEPVGAAPGAFVTIDPPPGCTIVAAAAEVLEIADLPPAPWPARLPDRLIDQMGRAWTRKDPE